MWLPDESMAPMKRFPVPSSRLPIPRYFPPSRSSSAACRQDVADVLRDDGSMRARIESAASESDVVPILCSYATIVSAPFCASLHDRSADELPRSVTAVPSFVPIYDQIVKIG